ncbi:hypothetical protein SETIT_1G113600v2 [Setaria italica]|uniref:Uncharacterized protein n=2 Tax=Setaria TaxID=4554 RepID=A0A368PJQ4_SETIT|nr:hypothetical protein SETIT_1G113600v2 [Setaria italica]TKW38416.1 hypothetical protein SEVIR_1G113000v2 [Setaria viridis]
MMQLLKLIYDLITRATADLIWKLFMVNGWLCLPSYINLLLWLMNNHFEDREIFPIHPGLILMISYPQLFKELYDLLKFKIDHSEYEAIFIALVAGLGNDWRVGVQENDLLCETYNFNGGSDYEAPRNSQNQRRVTGQMLPLAG